MMVISAMRREEMSQSTLLVYAKLFEKRLGKNSWFLFLVMHVEIWSSSILGLMDQNVKYFEIVGN